jgi:hypothetical protein
MPAEFAELFGQVRRRVERLAASDAGADRAERLTALRTELRGLRSTVTSPGGEVTVTCGPGGTVLDVRFTDRARRCDPARLSAAVMTAIRTAITHTTEAQRAVLDRHRDAESPAATPRAEKPARPIRDDDGDDPEGYGAGIMIRRPRR